MSEPQEDLSPYISDQNSIDSSGSGASSGYIARPIDSPPTNPPPPDRPDPAPITRPPGATPPPAETQPPKEGDDQPKRNEYVRYINTGEKIKLDDVKKTLGSDLSAVADILDKALQSPGLAEEIATRAKDSGRFTKYGDKALSSSEAKKITAATELYDVIANPEYYKQNFPDDLIYRFYKANAEEFGKIRNMAPTSLLALDYIRATQEKAFRDAYIPSSFPSRRSNPYAVSIEIDGAFAHGGNGTTSIMDTRKYKDPITGKEEDIAKVKDDYTFDRMIYQTLKRGLVPTETLIEWEHLRERAEQARRNHDEKEATKLFDDLYDKQYEFDTRLEKILGAPSSRNLGREDSVLYDKAHDLLRRFTTEGYVAVTQDTATLPELNTEAQQKLATDLGISIEEVQRAISGINDDDKHRRDRAKQRWEKLEQKVDTDPLRYRERAFKILWNVQKRRLTKDDFKVTTEISKKEFTQKLGGNDEEESRPNVTPRRPTPTPETLPELPAVDPTTPEALPVAPTDGGPEELPTSPISPETTMPDPNLTLGLGAIQDRIPQEVGNLADHVMSHDANKEPRRTGRRGIFFGLREGLRHPIRSWQNSIARPIFRRQTEDFVLRAENAVKGKYNQNMPVELTPELLDKMLVEGKKSHREGRFKRALFAIPRNILGLGLKTDQHAGLKWLNEQLGKNEADRDPILQQSTGRMLVEQNKIGERYANLGGLNLETSNKLALKQGELGETRHKLILTTEQQGQLNSKVKELLTKYHNDQDFSDEKLVAEFNSYLTGPFMSYIPEAQRGEFNAPEYASNILTIAHKIDGRTAGGAKIEGSTSWESYQKPGENNVSTWDKLNLDVYYGKAEWGAVRGKNEETLTSGLISRRLESRDFRNRRGGRGAEYATVLATYGGSYLAAYGAVAAGLGRGFLTRMIPFVGPASVAAIRESGLGWSFRGKWRGFKGNVAREIEQASKEGARGRLTQDGSPLRSEYDSVLVPRESAQKYIDDITRSSGLENPTQGDMESLLVQLAGLKARLDITDASSTKNLNFKVQNYITYEQGRENEQNAALRGALQSGVAKLNEYNSQNPTFLANRGTEIISPNGQGGLLDKYALVIQAQLRMSSDNNGQMRRWLRQTGLQDAEVESVMSLQSSLPQTERVTRADSITSKEWAQRRLSARKAAKMALVTGAVSFTTAGLVSEVHSMTSAPSDYLSRWRDIVSGKTPESFKDGKMQLEGSYTQKAVIIASRRASEVGATIDSAVDYIPYADRIAPAVDSGATSITNRTGTIEIPQSTQDIWSNKLVALDRARDQVVNTLDNTTLGSHVLANASDLQEALTPLAKKAIPDLDSTPSVENNATLVFNEGGTSIEFPQGVVVVSEEGRKYLKFHETQVDITGLSFESIPPSDANDYTGQLVIKNSAGNIITDDPASFFHDKGIPLEMDYRVGKPIPEQLLDSSLGLHKEPDSKFPDTLIPKGTHWQGDDLVLDKDPSHVLIHDVTIDPTTGKILFQTDHDPAVDYSGAADNKVVVNRTSEITLDPKNPQGSIPQDTQLVTNNDGSFDLVAKTDPSVELIEGARVDPTTGEITYESIHTGVTLASENSPPTTVLQSGLEGKLTATNIEANLPPGIKIERLPSGNIRLYPETDQSITLLEGKFDGNEFTPISNSSEVLIQQHINPDTVITGDVAKAELLTYSTPVEWGVGYWNDTSIAEKAELQMHTFHTLNGQGNHVLTVSLLTNPYDTASQTGVGTIYLPDVIKDDKIALTIWLPDHTGTPLLLRDSMDGQIDGSFVFDPDSTTPITLGNRATTIGELTKMVIDADALATTPMGNNATEYNQFFNVGKLGTDGKYGFFSTAYIARDGTDPLLREITTIKYNGNMNISTPGSTEWTFKTIEDITRTSTEHTLQIDEITTQVPGFIAVQNIIKNHPTRVPYLLISDIPEDSGFDMSPVALPIGRRNIEKSRGTSEGVAESTTASTPSTTPPTTQANTQDDQTAEEQQTPQEQAAVEPALESETSTDSDPSAADFDRSEESAQASRG